MLAVGWASTLVASTSCGAGSAAGASVAVVGGSKTAVGVGRSENAHPDKINNVVSKMRSRLPDIKAGLHTCQKLSLLDYKILRINGCGVS
jgi:hypothetical protein